MDPRVGVSRASGSPLERAAIITGERLQGLAQLSLVSARTKAFHRRLTRHAQEVLSFREFTDLSSRDIARISRARSLFVYTHELDAFADYVWPHLDGRRYVLITHNSDGEIGSRQVEWLESAGDKLGRWFAQNVTVEHAKLVPLPLGIANSMWPHGNLRVMAKAIRRAALTAPTHELFARFSPGTHPDRAELGEVLRLRFPAVASEASRRIGFRDYLEELARHEYCVCPRGNGIDTHRLWEALYLGVTPIVTRSIHTEHWQALGLPLMIVDRWSDLSPSTIDAHRAFAATSADMACLDLDYWRRPVLASIAERVMGESTDETGAPSR
jgi:hypothetical protein